MTMLAIREHVGDSVFDCLLSLPFQTVLIDSLRLKYPKFDDIYKDHLDGAGFSSVKGTTFKSLKELLRVRHPPGCPPYSAQNSFRLVLLGQILACTRCTAARPQTRES
jgi:hypothetical protein